MDTLNKLRNLLVDELGASPDEVRDDVTLEVLEADSLDGVGVMMRIEDEFHISLKNDDLAMDMTVAQMASVINKKVDTSGV